MAAGWFVGINLIEFGCVGGILIPGEGFWNALSAKDTTEFYTVLGKYLAALVLGAPIITMYRFQRDQLAVHWREWMTARTFDLYTSNRVYYNLDVTEIDNPDQRITEDVQSFTGFSLRLVITLITSVIDLVSFSFILWSIYPQLFTAIVIYASAGTIITAWLGKSLVHLNVRQLRREADLRYSLVRIRENAESIAFYAGEDLEGQAVEQRLERVTENRRALNVAQRNLEFFTTSYRYLVQIVPVAVVAPRYFSGDIALGLISQAAGAFNHILSDLSIIVNQFEQLSSFSAGIERLATFYEAMRNVDPLREQHEGFMTMGNQTQRFIDGRQSLSSNASFPLDTMAERTTTTDTSFVSQIVGKQHLGTFGRISLQTIHPDDMHQLHETRATDTILSIQNLDLCTPDRKRVLVRKLNVELQQGEHLLIVGNSGAGKSSLLRAIAGLWTIGNGSIQRPSDEHVYFLPQRPYCALGSLKDQLLYPSVDYSDAVVSLDNSTKSANGVTTTATATVVATATTSTPPRKSTSTQNKIVPRSHLLKDSWRDEDLLAILEKVLLLDVAREAGDGDPVRGLYSVLDWSNRLSLGEQQRLAFARLLVNRPQLVILDEATSALDIMAEARMYELLEEMAAHEQKQRAPTSSARWDGGLTYISVGHRPSLLAFHHKRLRMSGPDVMPEVSDISPSSISLELTKQVL